MNLDLGMKLTAFGKIKCWTRWGTYLVTNVVR